MGYFPKIKSDTSERIAEFASWCHQSQIDSPSEFLAELEQVRDRADTIGYLNVLARHCDMNYMTLSRDWSRPFNAQTSLDKHHKSFGKRNLVTQLDHFWESLAENRPSCFSAMAVQAILATDNWPRVICCLADRTWTKSESLAMWTNIVADFNFRSIPPLLHLAESTCAADRASITALAIPDLPSENLFAILDTLNNHRKLRDLMQS
jgi:hypothetical protein